MNAYGPMFNTVEGAGSFTASIATMLQSSVTDADAGAVQGVAISSLTALGGTFEYSTNGGTTWTSVGSVSATNALLLRSTDLVRVTPDANNGGTITAVYRAWDQTSGTAGTKVDASITGGTTAFSTGSDQVVVNVTSTNDAPILDSSGTMSFTAITEDKPTIVGNRLHRLF